MEFPTIEGHAPFNPPGAVEPCYTWYKIIGELPESNSMTLTTETEPGPTPLLIAHGGPGTGHEIMLALTDLYSSHKIPLIFYDQLGCGNSTRLDSMAGDLSFWIPSLFVAELTSLIQHLGLQKYDVLGTSWGGVLAAKWAGETAPQGLRRLVLSSTIASMPERIGEMNRLVSEMPEEIRDTIQKCQRDGTFENEEFKRAFAKFSQKYVCRTLSDEEAYQVIKGITDKAGHVYKDMYGVSFLAITGTMKDLDNKELAKNIKVPTLLINGEYDGVTDACVKPYFLAIEKVKWITVADASHMIMHERREKYMRICADFLV